MNTEKARLERMLTENKISQHDYNTLLVALEKKSFFSKMQSSLLLNPFQKIAGFRALLIGMIIMFFISYFGVMGKLYFLGSLSMINASVVVKQTRDIGFLLLAYQNVVSWIVLTTLFIISAKILQNKNLRIIDFFGTVALARFPLLLFTLLWSIIRQVDPAMLEIDVTKGFAMHWSMEQYLLSAIGSILIVWQIITYFYAFKESSGLVGKKLWLGFVISIVSGEFIAWPLATILMN